MPELAAGCTADVQSASAGERVHYLQIEPTTRCNYTCGFCAGRHMPQADMNLEVFKQTLDALPDLEHLDLQGEGEPLLHRQFFDMARMASDRGIAVSAITNGSLFSPGNVDRILTSGLDSLLISIESPDPGEFQAIRGGKLHKLVDGIRAMLAARAQHQQRKPALGFAFTLMRDSRDRLAAVADLYHQLGMDGGILVQQLSGMASYARHYDDAMVDQCLSGMERLLSWTGANRTLRQAAVGAPSVPHFWHHLLSHQEHPSPGAPRLGFTACPWLMAGLYIDRNGVATACPKIKDISRFAIGVLSNDSLATILARRADMNRTLQRGAIPESCRGCDIGESVAKRSSSEASGDAA